MATFRSRLKRKRRVRVGTRNVFRRGMRQRKRHARIYRRAVRNYRRTGLSLIGAVRPTPRAPNRITSGQTGSNQRVPDKLYTKFPLWWYTTFRVPPTAFPTGQTFVGMCMKANSLQNMKYFSSAQNTAWYPTKFVIPDLAKAAINYTKYKILASKLTVTAWNTGQADYMLISFPSDSPYTWQSGSVQNLTMDYFMQLPNARYKMLLGASLPRKNYVKFSNYMSSKKIMEEADYADDFDTIGQILPIQSDGGTYSGPSATRVWFWNVVYFRMDNAALTAGNIPFFGTLRFKPYCVLSDVKPVFQSADEAVLADQAPPAEGS